MNSFSGLYDIRDMRLGDKNFILATFLKAMYYGDSWFSLIPKPIFMANYKKVAETLVLSRGTTVKIACLKDDPDTILGYSITNNDGSILHFVYVKSSKTADGSTWRNKGIARSLVPSNPAQVSHLTDLGRQLMHKFPNAIFNPFFGV